MSAILSTDDLNDFIGPGVACIKPVETLPAQQPDSAATNAYEVTTEDAAAAEAKKNAPAQISLTDCLACSGCVTSAEAVLVSLQSHEEVLRTLDEFRSVDNQEGLAALAQGAAGDDAKVFVASVSPQTRASLAAMYGIQEQEAGWMIEQLLGGQAGLRQNGEKKSGFLWVVDTNTVRDLCLAAGIEEVKQVVHGDSSLTGQPHDKPKNPILASSCPGWICYAEKTHPYILPHLSRLKSPQSMSGTLLKTVLSRKLGIAPNKIWHLAVMPCFDKKLEASRQELTDVYWDGQKNADEQGVRDVDCVITAREVLMLADSRGISFPNLPRKPVPHVSFPDHSLDRFLFPRGRRRTDSHTREAGPSGGYAYHILSSFQAERPGSKINIERGRNADVIEYQLIHNDQMVMKTARYYGFRNIQNLVRKLKPQKTSRLPGSRANMRANATAAAGAGLNEYAYVEVMACPGGCTNGGGQIKASDLPGVGDETEKERRVGPAEQKEWLARVDEAYYSADSSEGEDDEMDIDTPVNGANGNQVNGYSEDIKADAVFKHWSEITGIELPKLIFTSYRQVESDVGKESKKSDTERVATLANSLGGGW